MSIKFKIFAKNCSFCNSVLTNWDYRYKEKHYCRSCYENSFISKTCIVCNKNKKSIKIQKSLFVSFVK